MHPLAAEGAKVKKEKQLAQLADDIATRQWTQHHGLHYLHLRKNDAAKGGITVAYQKPTIKGCGMVLVSCAFVNPKDTYCKRVGRHEAAKRFNYGAYMAVRVPRNISISAVLDTMFSTLLFWE
jgi:hypothetical protein